MIFVKTETYTGPIGQFVLLHIKSFDFKLYSEIKIVRGGTMFVAFVGSTYTRIYIPTNVYKAYVKLYKSYPELAANEISSQ